MKAVITPAFISGTLTVPASKSAMQRACAAALVRQGQSIIHNPGIADDDKAALGVIRQLGAYVEEKEGSLLIRSNGIHTKEGEISCGESGLGIRMFTPLIAVGKEKATVTGKGSLLNRPMDFFDTVMPQLGVHISSTNGKLPLQIKGPLQPKNIEIDGSLSSQFLTGLLMAYTAAGATNVSIRVKNLKSKPYIDLTMQVLQLFHLPLPVNNQYEEFIFSPSLHTTVPGVVEYTVESDWSSASFPLVAGAISGQLFIKGLDLDSTQADKAVLQALKDAGAKMSIQTDGIQIEESVLQGFHFDATDCPDLFPPLVALAAHCEGSSVINGVHRLAHKESNRALTLQEEFGKMGIQIDLQDDQMTIKGGKVKEALVHSRHDHRIAMACAVAALKADGPVVIEEAGAVNKSYPQFWQHLQQLQVPLSLLHN